MVKGLSKLAAIALLCFCATATTDAGKSAEDPIWVSIVSLIATPEKYDGKYIRVLGIAYLDSKNFINAIYLTREDKLKANDVNGVFLYLPAPGPRTDRLNGRFVVAQGIFRSDEKGHLHKFPGSLID